MKIHAAAIILLSAASMLAASPAPLFAQARPAGSAQPDPAAAARSRFSEGVAFAKKKEWQKAYQAFTEAWTLKVHPQIALNLGRAEIEIGKYRDAIGHLGYCTSQMEAKDPDLQLAKEWLAEAEKKVGKLAITVDLAGAEVLVDGRPAGQTPVAGLVLVDPGKRIVKVRKGELQTERSVDVESGASIDVQLRLQPERPASTAAPAVTAPTQPAQPPTRPFPLRTVVLVGGGVVALAGVGLGAALGALSLDKQTERDRCTQQIDRGCWAPLEAERVGLARGSFAGFLGGGLFAAGTAAFLLFGPRDTKVGVLPSVGPTGAGLAVTGSF